MQKLIYRNSRGQEIALSNSRPFILESIGNASNISTNISTADSVADGISITDVSIKEKVLPVNGGIASYSKEDLDRKRNYLISILNPKLDGELIYYNNDSIRKIKCRAQDIAFNKPIGRMQKFLIQFICPKPFWEDLETRSIDVARWEGGLEFDIDLGLEIPEEGIELGYRVSNLISNVINPGDVECGMVIQFKALATVVDPSILNIDTREFIKINRTLEKGDILEVSTEFDNKRIELVKNDDIRENVFNWLDWDSEFIELDVGDNLLRYDATSGIDNLDVSIYYKPLYLGV